jgi:tetratricopeptide (TPR) repeat protein
LPGDAPQRSRDRGDEGGDAADLVMRGNALVADMKRKEIAIEAISLFERALALDPHNVGAMIGIATTRTSQYVNQFQTSGREELLTEAETLIAHAIALAPDHIGVRRARAVLLRASGRFEDAEAVDALRLAVHSNPNIARAMAYLAAAETLVGNIDAAKLHLARLNELDPGLTVKRFVEERSSVPLASVSAIYRRENERILQALCDAGMPER